MEYYLRRIPGEHNIIGSRIACCAFPAVGYFVRVQVRDDKYEYQQVIAAPGPNDTVIDQTLIPDAE